MRDFPIFATDNGVGSITLKEVPYTGNAYIKLGSAENIDAFLKDCLEFCSAVGATCVYATGHKCLEKYPLFATVVTMKRDRGGLPAGEAVLVPVTADNCELWRKLYNQKMQSVDNAAYITMGDMKDFVKAGTAWFVERQGVRIGIGVVENSCVRAMAATVKGAGKDVLLALCTATAEDSIELQVAQSNQKAMALYTRFGFQEVDNKIKWYKIT